MSCFDHARLQRSRMISDSTFTGGPTGALFWSSRDDHLSEPALKEFWQMGFSPMKFKPESGADRIKSADDAYSFMVHMRLSYQNKPHWQVARQAINQACMSEASEIRAWRSFRTAAAAEGWLEEPDQ